MMKRLINGFTPVFLCVFLLFTFSGCIENIEDIFPDCKLKSADHGKLLGQDPRDCACCGGYLIQIGEDIYQFYEEPACSNLDLKTSDYEFPLDVWVKWERDPEACLGDEVILSLLILR